MKVVDACAVVEVLLGSELGDRVATEIGHDRRAAPQLIYVEVTSTLARLVRANQIDSADADRAMASFLRMPIRSISHLPVTTRAWQLRDRVRITDGFYVACAQRLGCPLVTTDGRLSRASLPGVSIIYVQ